MKKLTSFALHATALAVLSIAAGCETIQSRGKGSLLGGPAQPTEGDSVIQPGETKDIITKPAVTPSPAVPAPTPPPAPAPASAGKPATPSAPADGRTPVDFVNVPKDYNGLPVVHASDIKTGSLPKPASDTAPMRTPVPQQAPGAPALPRIVKKYTVAKGDTLGGIAQKHGLRTSELLRVNSMGDANKIRVGQTINIPEPTPGVARPAATATVTAPAGGSIHTVASGETIGGIAHKYGLKTGDVLRANGLTEDSAKKIKVGQKIKIPAKTAANTYTPRAADTTRRDPIVPAVRPVNETVPSPAPAPRIQPTAPAIQPPAVQPPAAQPTPAAPVAPAVPAVPAVQPPAIQPPAIQPPAIQPPAIQPPAIQPPAIPTPAATPAAAGATRDYVVKAGDDIATIAKDHNMTQIDLITLNGFSMDTEVKPGDVVKVKGL